MSRFGVSSVLGGVLALAMMLAPVSVQESIPPRAGLTEAQVRESFKKQSPDLKEEVVKNAKGQKIGTRFSVTYRNNGVSLPIQVEVRDQVLWLNCWLGYMQPANQLNGEQLMQVLGRQLRTGPSFFDIVNTNDGPYLRMGHRVETTITLQRFYEILDEFTNDVNASRDTWQPMLRK